MEVESSGNNHVKDFEDGPVAKKTKVEGRYVDQDRCQLDLASDLGKICIADDITFEIVWNDKSNESCCKLIALKNIFSRQLPKMPKEYIVRLVFDHRHLSLAIKKQDRVIGGICYRPYYEQRFGEIAFCAISSTEQVRGYGSLLMNQLKHYVQKDKLEYFLTYADNFAIGYFQKQGFSRSLSMPKERWVGFIKDYDGGTLMECYVHPGMDYRNVASVVAAQRAYIQRRLQGRSVTGGVHDGLALFQAGGRVQNLMDAPGVAQAGWTSFFLYRGATDRDRNMAQARLSQQLKPMLDRLRDSAAGRQFSAIVAEQHQKCYSLSLEVIMEHLKSGEYYCSKEALVSDLMRMIEDVRLSSSSSSEPFGAAHLAAANLREAVLEELDGGASLEALGAGTGVGLGAEAGAGGVTGAAAGGGGGRNEGAQPVAVAGSGHPAS